MSGQTGMAIQPVSSIRTHETGAGCFVAVVGPSGAGKDTLLRGVQERLAKNDRFVFARRLITRKPDGSEDHESLTEAEFEQGRRDDAFLLAWSANGLSYALPAELAAQLEDGQIIIANVSRAILPELRRRFRRSFVIHVTANTDILAVRLGARAREDAAMQQARLARALAQDATVEADVKIDNSGDLDSSIAAFEQALKSLLS